MVKPNFMAYSFDLVFLNFCSFVCSQKSEKYEYNYFKFEL